MRYLRSSCVWGTFVSRAPCCQLLHPSSLSPWLVRQQSPPLFHLSSTQPLSCCTLVSPSLAAHQGHPRNPPPPKGQNQSSSPQLSNVASFRVSTSLSHPN